MSSSARVLNGVLISDGWKKTKESNKTQLVYVKEFQHAVCSTRFTLQVQTKFGDDSVRLIKSIEDMECTAGTLYYGEFESKTGNTRMCTAGVPLESLLRPERFLSIVKHLKDDFVLKADAYSALLEKRKAASRSAGLSVTQLHNKLLADGWSHAQSRADYMTYVRHHRLDNDVLLRFSVQLFVTGHKKEREFKFCRLHGPQVNLRTRNIHNDEVIGEWSTLSGAVRGIDLKYQSVLNESLSRIRSILNAAH